MLTFLQEYKNSLLVDIPKHGIGEGPVVVVVGQLLGPPTVVLLPTAANFPTGPRLSLQKKSAKFSSICFDHFSCIKIGQKQILCTVFKRECCCGSKSRNKKTLKKTWLFLLSLVTPPPSPQSSHSDNAYLSLLFLLDFLLSVSGRGFTYASKKE